MLADGDKYQIRWIVDRLHVSATNRLTYAYTNLGWFANLPEWQE